MCSYDIFAGMLAENGNYSAPEELHKVDSTSTDLLITADPYVHNANSLPIMPNQQQHSPHNRPNSDKLVSNGSLKTSDDLTTYISKMEQLYPQIEIELAASGYKLLQESNTKKQDSIGVVASGPVVVSNKPQWSAQLYSKHEDPSLIGTERSTVSKDQMSLGDLETTRSQSQSNNKIPPSSSNTFQGRVGETPHNTGDTSHQKGKTPKWLEQLDGSDVTSITSDQPNDYSRQKVNPYLKKSVIGQTGTNSKDRLKRASEYLPKPKFTAFDKLSKIEHVARVNLGSPQAHSSRHGTPNTGKQKNEHPQAKAGGFKHNKTDPSYSETILKGAAEETQSIASIPLNELTAESVPKKKVNFTAESKLLSGNTTRDVVTNDTKKVLQFSGSDFASASIEQCAKHRDFAEKLLEEVEETGSSVVTAVPAGKIKVSTNYKADTKEKVKRLPAGMRYNDVRVQQNSSQETDDLLEAEDTGRLDITPRQSDKKLHITQSDQGNL